MFFQKKKLLIHICLLLFLVTSAVHAQTYKPLRALRSIKTEYFDIIYPKESELTAQTLAGFADDLYREQNARLGIDLHKRIPVIISPDTEQFNGGMAPIPYTRILIYDAPMDLEWTTFENSLYELFNHELVHAFTLNSRGPFFEILNRIMGGYIMPTFLNTPMFMAEGATVSFESFKGAGRTNDPLIKEKVRQAIIENNTLTPFQLSGTNLLPPNNGSFYEYGGLFSAYLQQRYGIEKYAELWQRMGRDIRLSFRVYKSGFYQIFTEVYNVPFADAWDDFLDNIKLENVQENSQVIPFKAKRPLINVLASSSEKVYFGNQYAWDLMSYDPKTETVEKFMAIDPYVYDMAISPDEKTMLLSGYDSKGYYANAIVTEYDLSNGKKTGRKLESFYNAQYFRDGVIGIASDRHNNAIAYKTFDGTEEILVKGNEELLYASPHAINETWIMYIRAEKGVRELCMFNYETKKEYILQSNLEDDSLRWKYIRNLRVSNDQVMFVYNHDDRMYKLGTIDISQFKNEESVMNAVFNSSDFSGGVFLPAHVNGDIYYRGFFSDQDKLMQFPETLNALSGEKAEIQLALNEQNTFAAETTATAASIPESKPYTRFGYMNPFYLWLPAPLLRTDESSRLSFDGLGIATAMSDATGTNMVTLQAIGDWKAKMANLLLMWNNTYFGFPIDITFSDAVGNMYGSNSYRMTQASMTGTFAQYINNRTVFGVMGGVEFVNTANNPFDNSSAYTWAYKDPVFSGSLGILWSNYYQYVWQRIGTGISASALYRTPFDFSETRLDALISIGLGKIFPLGFDFYGAWDTNGMNIRGESTSYIAHFANLASQEYNASNGLKADWIAGGQVMLELFDIEIQNNISHLYFDRFYSQLAYRGVVYDSNGMRGAEGNALFDDVLLAQSLLLRLGFDISIPFSMMSAATVFSPNIWGAWKISNLNDGNTTNDFAINFGLSLSF
ncbi:MAG: hypothetical protein LBV20_04265 [Treponema sp.]|jgi:hypothetical protein|nr:hypothetical protein [Treponema sp.]